MAGSNPDTVQETKKTMVRQFQAWGGEIDLFLLSIRSNSDDLSNML